MLRTDLIGYVAAPILVAVYSVADLSVRVTGRQGAMMASGIGMLWKQFSSCSRGARRAGALAALVCFAGLHGCSPRPVGTSTEDAQILLRRGVALADRGDYRGAITNYDVVLHRQPQNAEAAYLRGSARDRLGDRVGALADYDAALRLDARLLPAYVARAAIQSELGDSAAAAADYRAARQLAGNDQVH